MNWRGSVQRCQIEISILRLPLANSLLIARRCLSAERCTRDLSTRSVTVREHSESPSAVIVCNTSEARFSRCNTCVTLAREMPCCRAKSAWVL